jgi:hypothetical protein
MRVLLALVLAGLATAGCGEDDGRVVEPAPFVSWPNLVCDALVPTYCGYPFPSNVHTVPDAAAPTGLRVHIDDAVLPVGENGTRASLVGRWATDGFSTGGALLCELPGATDVGLPSPFAPEESLAPEARTVLLHADTGARVPHFAELDKSQADHPQRPLMIRPLVRLQDGARYIVAVRGVQGADGAIPPAPAFAALRDRLPFPDDPSVDARRALYADIFQRLEAAGVARAELQLAWDFTTASRENNTAFMVHMRDEALAMAGEGGPPYTITNVLADVDEHVAFQIEGTFEAPLYLDDPGPGGRLLLGADGLPEPNAARPTVDVPFLVLIPRAAESAPAALLQYGHGLLGDRGQLAAANFRELIDDKNYVIFGLDLDGMANSDANWIGDRIAEARIDELTAMFDRQHQGMLQYLLAMRMMSRGFASDATYGQYIDADERYYHGISQGGIFGGTYMALSTDVTRGVLEVMGMSYNLLLNRSVDFGPFFALLTLNFPDPRDQQLLLGIVQLFWDRTEPNGYFPYLRDDPLPNTPPHDALLRAAIGDHQVTTLGGQLMARAVNAVQLPGVRSVYGLETVAESASGSVYVEYDFGLPPEPVCDIPMTACDDPHGKIRHLQEADDQLDAFLRTGRGVQPCAGGVCQFPELSGCTADDVTPTCPD